METVKALFAQLFGSAIGIIFFLCGTLGWAYWMWMAIKLGSFGMFFFEFWDRSRWSLVYLAFGHSSSAYRIGFSKPPFKLKVLGF